MDFRSKHHENKLKKNKLKKSRYQFSTICIKLIQALQAVTN